MTNPAADGVPEGVDTWLTIEEAADAYSLSPKTIRRRAQTGQLEARKAHDPALGSDRWYVAPPPTPRAELVPIELLDRLADAYRDAAAERARAEIAERTVDFERERRAGIEAERDELARALEAERSRRWWQRRI